MTPRIPEVGVRPSTFRTGGFPGALPTRLEAIGILVILAVAVASALISGSWGGSSVRDGAAPMTRSTVHILEVTP